jgi:flagellar biosynthesis protein FlhG
LSDQAQKLRELARQKRPAEAKPMALPEGGGRVLAITSGKGGVGKTNVVANLGSALAGRGHKVLALDADFGLANLDILLNLNPEKNLAHVLRGEATTEEVVVEALPGFSVLPGASGIQSLADMDALDREKVMKGLTPLVNGYDYVLIDTAAGIGNNVVELCIAAGEVVLVTNPQPTSLTDAYGLTKVILGRSPDIAVRTIVNLVSGPEEGRKVWAKLNDVVKEFLDREIEYLGHISRDDCVNRATSRQQPFVSAYPRSKATACVEKLADSITGVATKATGGMGGFLNRLLGIGSGK